VPGSAGKRLLIVMCLASQLSSVTIQTPLPEASQSNWLPGGGLLDFPGNEPRRCSVSMKGRSLDGNGGNGGRRDHGGRE